ncbi:TVP38 TMEM64 family membrane slr0305 isoform A [Chlorella sorokiniana]|uniref:TVP38 TMEM64 family membrane slr0305 isoform A n=1 Tax=Chlorella sorokiniana TaxID=3076 RepID=A0A2P6TDI4_CHLSO|nr:TVP38 TMEM64 family membrane slr0305 isoform A [Chlorella sorokiniana]|eukprot:PRW20703.1 TVP38 TMEM64 family membrane slr0305 isoform A [Chlorella sorokiniana]
MLRIPLEHKASFLAIGFVEAVASLLGFVGAARLPGVVLPLLGQTILIWQVLLATLVLKKRLGAPQFLGVGLVLAGVCLAAWPADPAGSPLAGVHPVFPMIYVFSMLLPAVDTVLKEFVFTRARLKLGTDLDLFVMNTSASVLQAMFVFLLLPITLAARGMSIAGLPSYIADGWQCFRGLTPSCGSDCSGAPLLPLCYVALNLLFNISALDLIRQAGNVAMSLVMSSVVPLTIVCFTIPFPFLPPSPPLGQWFGLEMLLSAHCAALPPPARLAVLAPGRPGWRRSGATRPCSKPAASSSSEGSSFEDDGAPRRRGSPAVGGVGGSMDEGGPTGGLSSKIMASAGIIGGLVLLAGGTLLLRDQVSDFIDHFTTLVENWGPLGYAAYILVYAALEILALPAIPLTMTAGAIFGTVPGTCVVSVAATIASTVAFLIARYVARDRVQQYAKNHPKFAAIDAAIGKDGLRVVLLLRLSPLLPLAASNYLYGLTSVDLRSYVLGSWLGMLPGTAAYVAAGRYSKELLEGGVSLEGAGWKAAVALGVSLLAIGYVGRLATKAVEEYQEAEASIKEG